MSNESIQLTSALHRYLLDVSLHETPLQCELREETATLEERNMQIAPEQGQFMALLIKLVDAKHVIEVGTFTGYSALSMALALPDDGELICCDINEEWTTIAEKYWKKAGVAPRIDLRLAPAAETLDLLINERPHSFDLIFIDADKPSYQRYYESALTLLRTNGVVLIDNTLWGGDVIDESKQDEDTIAIRAFNHALSKDTRVEISMLPVADGLTLARKR
ncbi:MAG: class I SAM-dependent methyltransferase [Deltaproteobacteria bacterium]|nr:class I SAM-dependent methyltransferase [Deltaproteobacteria bacterium]